MSRKNNINWNQVKIEKEIAQKAKEEMIEKFKDCFCETYCRFYGNEDYCKTCPMNKKNEFME